MWNKNRKPFLFFGFAIAPFVITGFYEELAKDHSLLDSPGFFNATLTISVCIGVVCIGLSRLPLVYRIILELIYALVMTCALVFWVTGLHAVIVDGDPSAFSFRLNY